MKVRNLFQSLVRALAISSLLSLPAHANTNGQQLQITTWGATEIIVTGTNQNGDQATWTASGDGSQENRTFRTDNWWWKGKVTIVVKKGNSQPDTCSVDVPPFYPYGDVVSINCGARLLIP